IHPTSALASDLRVETASLAAMAMQTMSIPEGQVWKTYYYAGSQRVAMRVQDDSDGDEVYYLFSDHLGSTSVSYRASDDQTIPQYYYPWGTVRPGPDNDLATDYTFTGQRSEVDSFGLMYYNARWYDPALGRLAQADSIIPEPGNPVDWDRYAYARNNPVKYRDPSGHWPISSWKLISWIILFANYSDIKNTPPNKKDRVIVPDKPGEVTSWTVDVLNTNATSDITQELKTDWANSYDPTGKTRAT
ncbi:MAG: RHS repeat-associated core domain-containing protein, partial [Chloroflexota bacterium]|nr:RHS repeat-associated core domain-containing protein [Chloroflexota bacterium]